MNQGKVKFSLHTDNDGDWRWSLVHENTLIVGASSEGYRNRADAVANARLILHPDLLRNLE